MNKNIARLLGLTLLLTGSAAQAAKSVQENRAADLHGTVDISGVSGRITVQGWDKTSVDVSGSVGDDVERVDVSGDPGHVTVQIVHKHMAHIWGTNAGAHLLIRLPSSSSLMTTLVSADFRVSDFNGDLELHTVSGEVSGDVGGNVRVTTVSGDVHVSARQAKNMAVKTVSGDVTFEGGSGESDVSTVSGDARVTLGAQTHAHFKTVSGDFTTTLGLAPDAQVDGETVSGEINVRLIGGTSGEYDISTHSGEIDNCFGPAPVEPRHGPGSRLQFKDGNGGARVRIVTGSGDVKLCNSGK